MCLFQLYSIHMKKQNSCLGPVRLFVSAVKISGKLKHSYECPYQNLNGGRQPSDIRHIIFLHKSPANPIG